MPRSPVLALASTLALAPALSFTPTPALALTSCGLIELSLRFNELGDAGAGALGKSLCSNSVLRSLNLGGNLIGPDGVVQLAEGLRHRAVLNAPGTLGIATPASCLLPPRAGTVGSGWHAAPHARAVAVPPRAHERLRARTLAPAEVVGSAAS